MRLIQGQRLAELVESSIKHFVPANVHDTELDICLGNKIWVEKDRHNTQRVHVMSPNDWNSHLVERVIPPHGVTLLPRRFMLAETREYFDMPPNVQGMLTLRSWAAKTGLEQSSSLLLKRDWSGHLIMELFNSLGTYELWMTPGLPIAQIQFFDISEDLDDGK